MTDADDIRALRAELEALVEEVASLKRAVADARGRVTLGMRSQVRCPSCGNRRIAHFAKVPDMAYGAVVEQGLAYDKHTFWKQAKITAKLEAHACTGCGLVEWHVRDTSVFAEDSELWTVLTSEDPGAGPFR